ncbi:hypothetical protein C8R44DRAFT_854996 [Mycena epipterygia]|nr:hypothetical protein C8R44DRAFT_854996 [Mycena epipterygia]
MASVYWFAPPALGAVLIGGLFIVPSGLRHLATVSPSYPPPPVNTDAPLYRPPPPPLPKAGPSRASVSATRSPSPRTFDILTPEVTAPAPKPLLPVSPWRGRAAGRSAIQETRRSGGRITCLRTGQDTSLARAQCQVRRRGWRELQRGFRFSSGDHVKSRVGMINDVPDYVFCTNGTTNTNMPMSAVSNGEYLARRRSPARDCDCPDAIWISERPQEAAIVQAGAINVDYRLNSRFVGRVIDQRADLGDVGAVTIGLERHGAGTGCAWRGAGRRKGEDGPDGGGRGDRAARKHRNMGAVLGRVVVQAESRVGRDVGLRRRPCNICRAKLQHHRGNRGVGSKRVARESSAGASEVPDVRPRLACEHRGKSGQNVLEYPQNARRDRDGEGGRDYHPSEGESSAQLGGCGWKDNDSPRNGHNVQNIGENGALPSEPRKHEVIRLLRWS